MIAWLLLVSSTYLLGSFPSAYLMGRVLRGVDIRELGDGNAGAANTYRELGATAGVAVWALDVGKGIGAVLLARYLVGTELAEMWAGGLCIGGHVWPAYLGLRGGRGASSALGVLLVLMPKATVPLCLLATAVLARRRDPTAACACLFAPLFALAWYLGYPAHLVAYAIGLPVLVGTSHLLSLRRPLTTYQGLPQRGDLPAMGKP